MPPSISISLLQFFFSLNTFYVLYAKYCDLFRELFIFFSFSTFPGSCESELITMCLQSHTLAFPGKQQYPGWFQLSCSLHKEKAKGSWLLGHRTNKACSAQAKLLQKGRTSVLLLAHSRRLELMAVCELTGLAGVLCQMITKPTPAATSTMSKLVWMAADKAFYHDSNAVSSLTASQLWSLISKINTALILPHYFLIIIWFNVHLLRLWFLKMASSWQKKRELICRFWNIQI